MLVSLTCDVFFGKDGRLVVRNVRSRVLPPKLRVVDGGAQPTGQLPLFGPFLEKRRKR